MAGGGYAPGFNPRPPGAKITFLAKGLGAAMWFFIFYRMRQDGHKLIGQHGMNDDHGHGGHEKPH